MTEVPEVPAREVGAEYAKPCPVCGTTMVVTQSPYGSFTASCPACREKAMAPAAPSSLPREVATPPSAPVEAPPTSQEATA